MAEINPRERTVKIKIVYYGPPLGGKTTNLQVLHQQALGNRRGEMISVNSLQDRTILFDLLPIKTVGLRGFDLRLQLLAVPGQVMYSATRRVALKGADGVVFVANSAEDRWQDNVQSLRELTQHLFAHQLDPASIPLVLQYNKRDLPAVTSVDVMNRHLNTRKEEAVPAVAIRGEGVLETLTAILTRTLREVSRRFRVLETGSGLSVEAWARDAVVGMFGREKLGSEPDAAAPLTRSAEPAFGLPDEFELESHVIEPEAPPAYTLRLPTPEAARGSQPGLGNPAAIAESYAEACTTLALDLTEARAESALSRSRLEEVQRAVAMARRMPSASAEARLRRILASLGGEADAASATVALWEGACRAEAQLARQHEVLLQSEKLVAMGTLLAGVAHELNNPLCIIMGQAELVRRAAGGGPAATGAGKIIRAAERCTRIVRNFLALARQRPQERQSFSLNGVVEEAAELLAYPLRVDNIELTLDLARDLPTIWGDPHQIQQVIVNLVTNAQHAMRAMHSHRQIVIATRLHAPGSQVVLQVSDTGPGIPREIQSRIFEPFFTTKPAGEGTGLGLSLCHGIVAGHEGQMRVESEPGQGASFVIELPVDTRREQEASAAADPAAAVPGKSILVVDDEPELAAMLVEMLAMEGHEVETAGNGKLALEKLERRAYDVILSDLRMPVLDGPGLFREVASRHPQMSRRFIFLTGDTFSPESGAFLERAGVPALSKPLDFEQFRHALRQVSETAAVGGPRPAERERGARTAPRETAPV